MHRSRTAWKEEEKGSDGDDEEEEKDPLDLSNDKDLVKAVEEDIPERSATRHRCGQDPRRQRVRTRHRFDGRGWQDRQS
eukprot:COSAG01_NODE_2300_length_7954_cov_7.117250_2_plen_79_part_00